MPEFEEFEVVRPVRARKDGAPHRYVPGETIVMEAEEGHRLVGRFILRATGKKAQNPEQHSPQTQSENPAEAEKGTEATPVDLVNLNSASVDDLAALPNLGRTSAEQIVASRPYGSVEEVPQRAGLTGKAKNNWFDISRMVTV